MKLHSTFSTKDLLQEKLYEIANSKLFEYRKIKRATNEQRMVLDKQTYHFIAQILRKPQDRYEHLLFSILYKIIFQTETITGNSAMFCYLLALHLTQNLTQELSPYEKQFFDYNEMIDNQLQPIVQDIVETCHSKDIDQEIDLICSDSSRELKVAIKEALRLSGLNGTINVEKGKLKNFIVELKNGYRFKLEPFKFMLTDADGKQFQYWDFREVKVLLVDGILEQVSQIDQILMQAMESKQPLIILAHGFSEEVVATCKTNNDRGNFNVMPVRTYKDYRSVHMVRDIAVVCETVAASPTSGQELALIKWEDLPVVPRVTVGMQDTSFETKTSRETIARHLKDLLSIRQSADTIEEVKVLIDERIKSMSTQNVTITLPDCTLIEENNMRKKIDQALRNTKTILNYGTINLDRFYSELSYLQNDGLPKSLIKALLTTVGEIQQSGNDRLPALSVLLGMKVVASSIIPILVDSSGYVHQITA